MHVRFGIFGYCSYHDRKAAIKEVVVSTISSTSFDLREEYTNAFRTESYNEFWAHVLDLTLAHGAALTTRENSAAARLPSYRLFAEQLLEPDQATVAKMLANAQKICHPKAYILLQEYYAETANASLLCSLLLKDIEQIRLRYRPLKANLRSLVSDSPSRQKLQAVDRYLADIAKTLNPFESLASSSKRQYFKQVQDGSASLLKKLESGRRKAKAKLHRINHIKRALAVSFVILTASTSVVGAFVAMHALVALLAVPTLLSTASFRFASSGWLRKAISQLDAATKGTYILNRDLDTISRLVARLHDEVDHMGELLRLCFERRDGGRRRLVEEVIRQVWKNDASFNQQLDELEEHLYLCFMTINKARSLVMKEVLVASRL
ncbi:UPF0496 protein 3-like isoform X1 [Typha angustifolia]|uniref:UPF0496 protein 3-like isoform X1 n=1 Tax=Typha angustifolia TaxID=59011 RepID=UPI003C2EBF4A